MVKHFLYYHGANSKAIPLVSMDRLRGNTVERRYDADGRIWLPDDAEQNPVPAVLEYVPYRKRDGTYELGASRLLQPA
jgi:hypothetical protein